MQVVSVSFSISDAEFELFRDLVYKIAGINLGNTKKMLVVSRLSKRLRTLQLSTFTQYYEYLTKSPGGADELHELINLITTNKTDFFREQHHFDVLAETILPELSVLCAKNRNRDIRIWSAGCSTGEEPYTLAMVVDNFLAGCAFKPDVRILATDIDSNVLAHAQAGIYKEERLVGVPSAFKSKYFTKESGNEYRISSYLQKIIHFGRFNLTHDFPFKRGFDVILCRNVLIYFTPEDRRKIAQKFCSVLRPRGYLALGHSESLVSEGLNLDNLGMTLYRDRGKKDA